ncbi:MAG: exo-alpha-sialidase [Acidobacteria bacterium]|nr:exo-alpha-sialidase [Acidobacteriota bacterium]
MKKPMIGIACLILGTVVACAGETEAPAAPETLAAEAPATPTILDNPAATDSTVPHLGVGADDSLLMSWLEAGDSTTLRVARLDPATGSWTAAESVYSAPTLFANWADFPSVVELTDGALVTHWLEYLAEGRYAYGVKLAQRDANGVWGEPWQPHEDSSPVEHGFVSLAAAADGGYSAIWLDGTAFADGNNEMSVRARHYGPDGAAGSEEILDLRACDCCQTGAAYLGDNLVVVYRDRSPDEVRDIWTVRRTAEGWSEPQPVATDGWMIPGCPVNGPSIVSTGEDDGAVIWFALVDQVPEVKLAFTRDGGASFEDPILIEQGSDSAATLGRVDVASTPDGTLVATWLTQVGETAEIRYRIIEENATLSDVHVLATTGAERGSGFPRVEVVGQHVFFAWTDTLGDSPMIRTASMPIAGLPAANQ